MSIIAYWILAAVCAVLGVTDILVFIKTKKEKRARMQYALLICGSCALILAAIQVLRLYGVF